MSQNKKLIAEIERTVKKIGEGIELFDTTWERLHHATSVSLKERFQSELKTEIKKLQRMRDQIKTWQGMSDVRDKRAIDDCRKQIESKMEQFKACEREAKIKTFSKIGLSMPSKEDPEEVARENMRTWLNSSIDSLTRQIESVEADLESSGGKQKRKKQKAVDPAPGRDRIANYKMHIGKLEAVMRMLDNDKITPDEIEEVQDIVTNFIDNNTDTDYDPNEMEGVYDCLLPDDEAFPDTPTMPAELKPKEDVTAPVSKREEKKRKKKETDTDSKTSTPATPSMPTPPSQSLAHQQPSAKAAPAAIAPASSAPPTTQPAAAAVAPSSVVPTAVKASLPDSNYAQVAKVCRCVVLVVVLGYQVWTNINGNRWMVRARPSGFGLSSLTHISHIFCSKKSQAFCGAINEKICSEPFPAPAVCPGVPLGGSACCSSC